MRASRQVVAIALVLAACSNDPTIVVPGQAIVYFDTDAPVPEKGGRIGSAPPLFDRLRVDVFAPGASSPCVGCSNDFELDADLFRQRQVSIGLAPPPGASGYRVRARMYNAAFSDPDGTPNADSSIEVIFSLPVVQTGTVVERTVALATNDVGNPVGALTTPTEPLRGKPATSLVGTWGSAQRVDCGAPPPADAVCIPGGAYWMGNPNTPGFVLASTTGTSAGTVDTRQPRLIVLKPFYLSTTEVTVEQFRASKATPPVGRWSGSSTGDSPQDWCTFTPAAGPNEKLPVNCLSIFEARPYCTLLGGDLPTEAQFEYAAGALEGRRFPWGQDPPSCTEAVYGRAGWGVLSTLIAPCKTATAPGGATPSGTGTLDRVTLPGGATIVDLGGNVSEWTLDLWNRIDEPCWSRVGIYEDPQCTSLSDQDGHLVAVRGGNWDEPFRALQATSRRARDPLATNLDVGFRCAWPVKQQ
jgi:formylglycine-generating enzyme required for sulfatase activity